jgi:hypothetical protein
MCKVLHNRFPELETKRYFNPTNQGPITTWTLTFYNDAAGIPGAPIATGFFPGTGGETFIGNVNGFPIYVYWLYFKDFDVLPGKYWASVVPDLGFPPQWGWATSTGTDSGYQCFFGTCGLTGIGFSYAIDGVPSPEPGTLIMLGTGILGRPSWRLFSGLLRISLAVSLRTLTTAGGDTRAP